MKKIGFALAATVLVWVGAVDAHHSVNAQFDVTQNLSTTAVLKKVDLVNPHTYFHFIVTENGESYELSLETGAPIALQRAGLSVRDNLKIGETYKIFYSPARNGKKEIGLMHAMTLPDGKFIGFGAGQNIEAAREANKAE
jgi:Family of unknown function (DUF6152)